MERILIIDLDETLIHTFSNCRELLSKINTHQDPNIADRFYVFEIKGSLFCGIIRPGFKQFYQAIKQSFDRIVFWSAGTYKYVEKILKILMDYLGPELAELPTLVWSRQDCETTREIYHKPVSKIANYLNEHGIKTDTDHILILDDKEHTFIRNRANGLLIPAYDPKPNLKSLQSDQDKALFKFGKWAKSLDQDWSVSSLETNKIF